MASLLSNPAVSKFLDNLKPEHFAKLEKKDQLVTIGITGKIFHYIFTLLICLIGASVVVGLYVVNSTFGTNPLGRTFDLISRFFVQEKKRKIVVKDMIDGYNTLHDDDATGLDNRNKSYGTLVNAYYELATSFYEWVSQSQFPSY
jgi:hypothetical protein